MALVIMRRPNVSCFFASRLLDSSNDAELHYLLEPLLKERVQERIGAEGDALALAMRILACASVGVRDEVDLRTLLPLQCEDGGWEIGWVYKYGSSGIKIGNRGLTTALAVNAIEAVKRLPPSRTPSLSSLRKLERMPTPAVPETFKARVSSTLRGVSPTFRIRSGSFSSSYSSLDSASSPPSSPTQSSFMEPESPPPSDARPISFTLWSFSDLFRWLWHGGKPQQPLAARF